jgi:cell wall-associated NlpC family hydrolase
MTYPTPSGNAPSSSASLTELTGNDIVAEVEKFLGSSYVYGGDSPTGFDCSGLVQYALEQLGVQNVPRTSEEQWAWVTKINASQLAPGDLVFAQFPGDNASPGHVGVYVGNGQILSAEDPQLGVGYASLSSWQGNIVGYGQVPDTTPGTASASTGSNPSGSATYSTLGTTSIINTVSGLAKDIAIALDYTLGIFGRGQGWRIVFTVLTVVTAYMAYKCLSAVGFVPDVNPPVVVPV